MMQTMTKTQALAMLERVYRCHSTDPELIKAARQHVSGLHDENETLTKMRDLSPEGLCSKYHMQMCHCCERMGCGDNISPAKQQITDLTHQHTLDTEIITAKNEKIAELGKCSRTSLEAILLSNKHIKSPTTRLAKYEKPCDVCGGSGEIELKVGKIATHFEPEVDDGVVVGGCRSCKGTGSVPIYRVPGWFVALFHFTIQPESGEFYEEIESGGYDLNVKLKGEKQQLTHYKLTKLFDCDGYEITKCT